MFSFLCAVLLLVATLNVYALPLAGYGGVEAGGDASASFTPLAAALSLVPLSLLVVLKYAYVRFRRGQSIHAHPHTSSALLRKPLSSRSSASVPREPTVERSCDFWPVVTPYLVGFLGSPEWETKIRSRLDKTLRQAKAESLRSSRRSLRSPPYSPALGDISRTTANSSTAYYSSLSHKSRSRSKSLSVSFGDTSGDKPPSLRLIPYAYPAITDCAIIHPSSPPCQHGVFLPVPPPPAHTAQPRVRGSSQEYSPTLMQIMEPVLASWYDDAKDQQPMPNDTSQSSANTSRDKSTSSAESSLPFQTPMTSPPTPAMPGAFSAPSMPFSVLRKQLGVSATSSVLSISATTLPSPASPSVAVLHSPAAPSIRVPQPVYTPSLRPESCAVLPADWQTGRERRSVHALLQSPTHHSPVVDRSSGILDVIEKPKNRRTKSPKVSFSPVLGPPASPALSHSASAGPIVLKSALKKPVSGGMCTSPSLPSSMRNSVSFSLMSLEVPGTGVAIAADSSAASLRSSTKSWDLSEMMRDGQLDVDAVTRVLGLGLGMGLGLGSRSSIGSIASAVSASLAPSAKSTAEEPADVDAEYDVEQYAAGWGSPNASGSDSLQLRWHVPGMQLFAIPEESRSDVCSVAGSVHTVSGDSGDGVVSMELDSGYMHVNEERVAAVTVKRASQGQVPVQWESWREGESVVTLSVGIAW
ncbi:hypothetical protein BV20DRAFT_1002546 [Pilatotrama ljubarskyi]|nr:hypothetical protein BV20DRAFT_1002546 [Pilatotrama ljubarskyi]